MNVYVICQEDGGASLSFYSGKNCLKKLAVDAALIKRGEYAEAYAEAFRRSPVDKRLRAIYIMPQNMYGIDYVTVPSISKSRHLGLIRTELKTQYKNFNEMIFNCFPVRTEKTGSRYCLLMANKILLEQIRDVFSANRVDVAAFIPSGVAAIEGAGLLNSGIKKTQSLLFLADGKKGFIAECGRSGLLGDQTIPYGTNALSTEKVIPERLLYNPDSAQLLVINAKERAKATKLTMAINIEEEHIEEDKASPSSFAATQTDNAPSTIQKDEVSEPAPPAEEAATSDAEQNTTEQTFSTEDIAAIRKEAEAEKTEESDDYYEEDDQSERQDVTEEQKIKTLTKSAVRVLPKFMRRALPETPRGFILENFRLFEKKLLLLARELRYSEGATEPTVIFMYLPLEYSYIAEQMNIENPAYKWVNLNNEKYGAFGDINRLMIEGVCAKFLKIRPTVKTVLKSPRRKRKKLSDKKGATEEIKTETKNEPPTKKGDGDLGNLPYFKV